MSSDKFRGSFNVIGLCSPAKPRWEKISICLREVPLVGARWAEGAGQAANPDNVPESSVFR